MKVTISLDDELMKKIDENASENYMSRSGLISTACNKYLKEFETQEMVKSFGFAIHKIVQNGIIDKDIMDRLEDAEKMIEMITGM